VKESVESLLFVEAIDQKVKPRVWSNAALAVTKYLKGGWRLLGMLRLVPRPLRDFAYRTFARHRRQFAAQQCLVPPARTRARFLESAL
jgi:predicted DCC family thiol-disulfide oxidoreductase YuxK